MATPMRKYTRETWEEAALARCHGTGLQGTARLETVEEDGEGADEFWHVPSEDRQRSYTVVSRQADGHIEYCGCPAGVHQLPCKHSGAVLWSLKQRAAALAKPEGDYTDASEFR